ncbi:hypothetical protein CRG98_024464 [Punica granatum]|uniref:Uncharacterized protein n=1 Tax=Punica granatum TaxID=22663 RepID=A0A2I0JGQ1_PUNGR|nr:hypothetical protein CRG98_024464 [Punica granatum]
MERERFNRILSYYVGTHNFHNFTTRTKAEDPSASRYIISFDASNMVTVEGFEFVKCEVVGQSFMLHQIRKMMGLAVAIMRNCAPESLFEKAFEKLLDAHVRDPSLDMDELERMADSRGEIVVEVDSSSGYSAKEAPLFNKSSFHGKSEVLKIMLFHEAVAEAVRRGPNHDDDEDVEDNPDELKTIRFGKSTILQCVILVVILIALACSLLVPDLKRKSLWKWEVLLLALISGRLISGCLVRVAVIFAEQNFLLQKRVLYFTYGLRRAVQNFLWLGLVFVTWYPIFDSKLDNNRSRILPNVTKILVCLLVAALLWLLKTVLVKVLASSFHVNTYFERIHQALFRQYVIETLSLKPLAGSSHGTSDEEPGDGLSEALLPKAGSLWKWDKVGARSSEKNGNKIQKNSISVWYMKKMMHMIKHGSLSTLDEQILESDMEDVSHVHIDGKTECHARKAARKIFLNVAKPKSRLIYLDDLMRFMSKDDAVKMIRLLGLKTESDGIDKQALENWVIEAFKERASLARSLNDTNTAVDDLHNMLNVIVGIVTVIIWLIILGVPITQFLVFISSQLLLLAFVFGNSCKMVFEAIIFLFVMHPYDVGDRCEVDGVQMIVEEMNILTTVFLRTDNLKIRYPNNVLATKPISNYNRSSHMGETIDFCIHISTPIERIHRMKQDIKEYVESKSEHWHPRLNLIIKDVVDMNKMVMSLWLTHRMNHQEMVERWARRTLLVERMIEVFRQHEIEYRMLPLDVNVRNLPSPTPSYDKPVPSNWTACA